MNTQTKASFKKEFLAFFRTNRFLIIALSVIGLAALSPLLIAAMGGMMTAMSDIYDEFGMDITGMTDYLTASSSTGIVQSVPNVTGIALIVFLLLINRYAGGEQKKRSIIIPRSSGLRSFGYIFPKFIIYPLSAFILGFAGMIVSWFVSGLVFEVNDVTFGIAAIVGVLVGACLMLYVCFHLALGTATGKAGMSAAICIAASLLLPNILAIADTNYLYNPFALDLLAMDTVMKGFATISDIQEMIVTIIIALVLMIIVYFLALFAQNAKKIDNTGNEIDL